MNLASTIWLAMFGSGALTGTRRTALSHKLIRAVPDTERAAYCVADASTVRRGAVR